MDIAVGIETPSGKGAGDENFPVGSWLLPRPLRPHVATYYAFARAIDDIADNPDLGPEDKIRRLDGFAQALVNGSGDPDYAKADALRGTLAKTGISARHGLDLISAFKQDAVKNRYADWHALIDYCLRSASPVGRFLCDLHGEDKALYPLSDALCNALQVINHLQDCAKDYAALNRVYLPEDWMRAAGTSVNDLTLAAATPGMRRVLDQCLSGTERLMTEARRLPKAMRHRSLAAETAVIVSVADRLVGKLRRQDPLAMRVALGPFGFAAAATAGLARLWLA
ncbi:MAG: squalene synthase HpnC [Rhodospirillaceae bacterium]|nr:squalene synthase HpnC [Rhodospirillaceae bacterium]